MLDALDRQIDRSRGEDRLDVVSEMNVVGDSVLRKARESLGAEILIP